MNANKSRYAINLVILATLLLGACGKSAATPTVIPATATLTVAPPTATHTAVPPTNTPIPPTATPQPTATPNVAATRAAQATQTAAPVIALIDKELKKYDLSTSEGYLGWMDESTRINTHGYDGQYRQALFPEVSAADFVLHTDVTWETSTGLAGCALMFRSDGDLERGKHYRIYLMRLDGLPLWDIEYYKNGVFQKTLTGEPLPTSALNSKQGATNQVTVIAHGDKLEVYANDERLGAYTDRTLTQGSIAYMAWQESGETTCTFTNSWLWVFKGGG